MIITDKIKRKKMLLSAMLTGALYMPSGYILAAIDDVPTYANKMYTEQDAENLKWSILSDESFYYYLAGIANYLGYGWAGGTRSNEVGKDFEISLDPNDNSRYIFQAHYNKTDPYADGYWSDKRLKMEVSNVKFVTDLDTIKLGAAKTYDLEPIRTETYYAVNKSSGEDTAVIDISYDDAKSWSRQDTVSFTETIGISQSTKVELGFLGTGGSSEVTVNAEFSSTQGWNDTKGGSDSVKVTGQYRALVPPKTKRKIVISFFKAKADIPYTTDIYMDYHVTFDNFLRWAGNARIDHPTDRPWERYTFGGNNGLSAGQAMLDQYTHRQINGYSKWDWQWMIDNFSGDQVRWLLGNVAKRKYGASITGQFTAVDAGYFTTIADDPVALTAEEIADPNFNGLVKPSNGSMKLTIDSPVSNVVIKLADGSFTQAGAGSTTYNVAADGSGDYSTISDAVASLPDTGGNIMVQPGVYREKVTITKDNVSLIGMGSDASAVVISNNDSVGGGSTTSSSYTMAVTGEDFYATNLTIENTANYEYPNYETNGQAVALLSKGDRAVYRAVIILGGQDTLYVTNNKRTYFSNCYVEGYVDFIFGSGKAVFDGCTVKAKVHGNLTGQVTITAQSRLSPSDDSGFVFNNTKLLFDDSHMNNVWLGRPWRDYSTVYFLNTKMGPQVVTAGWSEFIPEQYAPGQGTNRLPTSTYREYNTSYNGSAFDIGQRESISPLSNVALSSSEVAALAADVYLKGSDNWTPTQITFGEQVNQSLPIPQLPVGAPPAPTINLVTAGNKNLQINWSGKAANPETTGYRMFAIQNGSVVGVTNLPATASTSFVTGLQNGVPATIQIAGMNSKGIGSYTQSSSVTPGGSAPSVPRASFSNSGSSVVVGISVEDDGGREVFNSGVAHRGIYAAVYTSKENAYLGEAISGTSAGFGATSKTFDGLSANTTYWISLWAYNDDSSPTAILPFYTSGINGFSLCASENSRCTFSGEKLVAYGANGHYAYQLLGDGVLCNNATFGDPIPGKRKSCYVK